MCRFPWLLDGYDLGYVIGRCIGTGFLFASALCSFHYMATEYRLNFILVHIRTLLAFHGYSGIFQKSLEFEICAQMSLPWNYRVALVVCNLVLVHLLITHQLFTVFTRHSFLILGNRSSLSINSVQKIQLSKQFSYTSVQCDCMPSNDISMGRWVGRAKIYLYTPCEAFVILLPKGFETHSLCGSCLRIQCARVRPV